MNQYAGSDVEKEGEESEVTPEDDGFSPDKEDANEEPLPDDLEEEFEEGPEV